MKCPCGPKSSQVPIKREISEKRDIVDVPFHASRAFVLGPSLGLGIPTSWGDGTKGMMEASNKGWAIEGLLDAWLTKVGVFDWGCIKVYARWTAAGFTCSR